MIQEYAKVMRNNTICIPKEIRDCLNVHESDMVIMTIKNHKAIIKKAPTWKDLLGLGKKAYAPYGGGEAYLKKERASWPRNLLKIKK